MCTKKLCRKGPEDPGGQVKTWVSNVFLWKSRPSTHWAVLARVWLKKAIPPLSSELMRSTTPGTLCSGEPKTSQKLGLPQQRNPAEDHTDNEGAEAHAVSGEAKSSGKEKAKEGG